MSKQKPDNPGFPFPFKFYGKYGGPGYTGGRFYGKHATPSDYSVAPEDDADEAFRAHDLGYETSSAIARLVADEVAVGRLTRSALFQPNGKPKGISQVSLKDLRKLAGAAGLSVAKAAKFLPIVLQRLAGKSKSQLRHELFVAEQASARMDYLSKHASELPPYVPKAFDPSTQLLGWHEANGAPRGVSIPGGLIGGQQQAAAALSRQHPEYTSDWTSIYQDTSGRLFSPDAKYVFDTQTGYWSPTSYHSEYESKQWAEYLKQQEGNLQLKERQLKEAQFRAQFKSVSYFNATVATAAVLVSWRHLRLSFAPERGITATTQKIGACCYPKRMDYTLNIRYAPTSTRASDLLRLIVFADRRGGQERSVYYPDPWALYPDGIGTISHLASSFGTLYHVFHDRVIQLSRAAADNGCQLLQKSIHFATLEQRDTPTVGAGSFPTNTLWFILFTSCDVDNNILVDYNVRLAFADQ